MIVNDLIASGLFSSFACTISSTLLIVYRIYNSLSNHRDNHSKKRFVHIVDVLVQSAAAYSLTLIVAAIAGVVQATSGGNGTLSMLALLSYEGNALLYFVSVRTFGVQILGKV